MAEKRYTNNTREADVERSSEDIRQDIAKGGDNISQAVDKIDERIQEKLDWREYVKDSPYWALGAAAGLGYFASRMFIPRTTPMERIVRSLADEARDSLGGLLARAAGPGLVKATLLGIAMKAAANWINNAGSADGANAGTRTRPRAKRGSAIRPGVDTQRIIKPES